MSGFAKPMALAGSTVAESKGSGETSRPPAGPESGRSDGGRLKYLLTTDFCPSFNRYVYWLKEPVGWFVAGAFFSTLVGIYLSPIGWTVAGSLVALIAVGLAFPWLAVRWTHCSLAPVTPAVHEGENCELELTVRNRLPVPVWGLMVERYSSLPDGEAGESGRADLALASVPPWSLSRYRLPFHPEYRGMWPLVTPQICCAFPFGIWTARRPLTAIERLQVWPMQIRVGSELEPHGRRRSMFGDGQRTGDAGEYLGVREYRQGDSMRNIRWSLSASLDRWIVSERSAPEMPAIKVSLFTGSCGSPTRAERRSNLAWRVRIAGCLAAMLHARQQPPLLVLDGVPHRIGPGPAGHRRLMELLTAIPLDPPAENLVDQTLEQMSTQDPWIHVTVADTSSGLEDPSSRVRVSVRFPGRDHRSAERQVDHELDLDRDLIAQLDSLIQEADHASMAA